ncbi:hypothetical protein EVAR_52329_1 [Eumeta japonica]|uniref:PiggyBac transposable element-derived protein domain-containing protein n=1 Tax=Eumeta variegata TaxID=151549 RepID=A0A4C1Y477_EUMVA|nr:hypothetical protein EVAR_52329_1 [Eumeta japonica]
MKKYRQRKSEEEKQMEMNKKIEIQTRFRNETGLLVDMSKANFGNTNDGNTSRRFFEDPKLSSDITGIDYELIYRLRVILETISSGYEINLEKYEKYAEETACLYVKLYPWHPMTPTLHKVHVHGSDIIKNALLPIGQLSEEAAKARNKHFRIMKTWAPVPVFQKNSVTLKETMKIMMDSSESEEELDNDIPNPLEYLPAVTARPRGEEDVRLRHAYRRSVNLLHSEAESVVLDWLRSDDEESNDEEREQQGGPPHEIVPNDFLSDSEDGCIPSDHESDSECSPDTSGDEETQSSGENARYYYGRNRYKWSSDPPSRNVRLQAHNIIRLPTIRNTVYENGPLSPLESFQLIFDGQMMEIIQQWTNKKLEKLRDKYPSEQYTFKDTDQIELKGFLSLLVYSAVFKSSHESVLSLFATDGTGRPIFRASMSK